MAISIEEHAAVVPCFSSFVYPGSCAHTDMCTCGPEVGGKVAQLKSLVTSCTGVDLSPITEDT